MVSSDEQTYLRLAHWRMTSRSPINVASGVAIQMRV